MPQKRLSTYLLAFVVWSVVFAGVYHLVSGVYTHALVLAADALTDFILPVTLKLHPNGLIVFSPEASAPMGTPYRLYLIGLNVIFAPALVLTSIGANIQGAIRAGVAVLIVMLFQTIQVVAIVLFSATHPDNQLFNLHYADVVVASFSAVYFFLDRMGYALIPFTAWAIACADRLPTMTPVGAFSRTGKPDAGPPVAARRKRRSQR